MKDHDFTILEQTIRQDERNKVIEEVEGWINQLPDWQWRVTREALVTRLNQLKGITI